MKIVIDLEDIRGFEEETIATTISDIIRDELVRSVRAIAQATVKENKEQIQKAIKKAISFDEKLIANIAKEVYAKGMATK